jgi:hypothetical protein
MSLAKKEAEDGSTSTVITDHSQDLDFESPALDPDNIALNNSIEEVLEEDSSEGGPTERNLPISELRDIEIVVGSRGYRRERVVSGSEGSLQSDFSDDDS